MTTYRGVAAAVAQDKASHPERFCPTNRCLWRTGGGYCPRHPDPSKPDDRPRAMYLLPDGRTVEKVFPRGTTPPDVSTYTYLLGKGRTVTVTRIDSATTNKETDHGKGTDEAGGAAGEVEGCQGGEHEEARGGAVEASEQVRREESLAGVVARVLDADGVAVLSEPRRGQATACDSGARDDVRSSSDRSRPGFAGGAVVDRDRLTAGMAELDQSARLAGEMARAERAGKGAE